MLVRFDMRIAGRLLAEVQKTSNLVAQFGESSIIRLRHGGFDSLNIGTPHIYIV